MFHLRLHIRDMMYTFKLPFVTFLALTQMLRDTLRCCVFPESACEGFFVKPQNLYYIFTPSHLLIYIFTPSHLQIHIFTPSHLQIYIFSPSHLQIYIFTPSYLQIYIFTPSHLQI